MNINGDNWRYSFVNVWLDQYHPQHYMLSSLDDCLLRLEQDNSIRDYFGINNTNVFYVENKKVKRVFSYKEAKRILKLGKI